MSERRRSPRFPVHFRVYYPDKSSTGHCSDISFEGCRLWVPFTVATGHIIEFVLELPVIGSIQLTGYVQHADSANSGVGVQLIQIRFSQDDSVSYHIYIKFLRIISQLKEVRNLYEEMVETGQIQMSDIPEDYIK